MFWFKISAEKHVFKLVQSVLVYPSLILPPPPAILFRGQSVTAIITVICFKCKT